MPIQFIIIFTLVITLFFLSNIGFARSKNNMNLGDAINQVKQHQGGQIISARTKQDQQQRNIHNIRVLTPQGKVKRYQINESNGQFIDRRRH